MTDTKDKAMDADKERDLIEVVIACSNGQMGRDAALEVLDELDRAGFQIVRRLASPPAPQAREIERVRRAIKAAWYERIDLDSDLLANAAIAALRSAQAPAQDAEEIDPMCARVGHRWAQIGDTNKVECIRCGVKASPARTYADGWQPIETAPKDGSLVLVKCAGSFHCARYMERESPALRGPHMGWWASGGMKEPMLSYDPSDCLLLNPLAWQSLED